MKDAIIKTKAFSLFLHDVETDRLSHAYLIIGEDGHSRAKFLYNAAQAILCPRLCGVCAKCLSLEEGACTDIYRLDGLDKLRVDDISALSADTLIMPADGGHKVYVIDNADKLSVAAQNKLLKTYEEPPSYVTIILGVSSLSGLLSTIVSRGKKIYIELADTETVFRALLREGLDASTAKTVAMFSAGNMEKALLFSQQQGYAELFDEVMTLMLTLKASSQIVEFVYTAPFSSDNIRITLDLIEIILCDVMKITSASNASRQIIGRDADMTAIAEGFNVQSASMAIHAINEGRAKLKSNVSALSAGEFVLFGILEAKHKWQR